MNELILTINVIVYLIMFVVVLKKYRFVDAFIWLIYLVIGVFALLLYLNPLYFSGEEIKIFPFVYLFIGIYITYLPIKKFPFNKEIIPPDRNLFNIFLWIIAIVTLINLPVLLNKLISNFHNILSDESFFLDQYQENRKSYTSGLESGGVNYLSVVTNIIGETTTFFFMYYLTLKNRSVFFTVVLFLAMLMAPIQFLLGSQRGGLVSSLLMIIVTYLFFKDAFSDKMRLFIRKVLIVVVVLCFWGIIAITLSRFFRNDNLEYTYLSYPILSYLGQPMLNFDFYALDPGGLRYGDRAIPILKMLFCQETAYTYDSRMDKYSYLKIQEDSFSTFVGDLAIDFGAIMTLIFIAIISFVIYILSFTKSKSTPFYKIIPIYALVHFMVTGWTLNRFGNIGGNLSIILYLLMYVYFKLKIKHSTHG